MNRLEIGNKIRELRSQKNLSQEDLAYLCKMNVRSIQRLEAGEVRPRPYTIRTLSDVLDYKFEYDTANETTKVSFSETLNDIGHTLSNFWSKIGEKEMRKNSVLHQLARSNKDRVFAGICGGLGEYTAVPAWFWRMLFCLFTIVYGVGVLVYGLMWIFMPCPKEKIDMIVSSRDNWLSQLKRSTGDKRLGGVCGGLGESSPIPSWVWRVLFVLSVVLYGYGIVLYILLWIYLPKSKPEVQETVSVK